MLRNHSHFPLEQCRFTYYFSLYTVSITDCKSLEWNFPIGNSITSQLKANKAAGNNQVCNQRSHRQ